ncbi:iron-sulfur cluster repair protein YtfE [Orrella dioscoreae]|uniref:Nitric oxide-dependent regulator DnrN or NorA n=1 Tax=Orrella dioscoreae TaxID=1851544 RepID=A0A1C3JYW9_9BURK|nr:iron-sulfur cluster repair protein YtfE [Orrella dioscoreae]SBT24364.1 Nitric oxide-dependent regulator DnrN or NorA [Orrella dioscoreae]SOE47959.1 Nitric oxide-dependent regulator DnrN or NorA [Orrella dioscoreae]
MNLIDQSLGQLARQIPGATQVFHLHGLDFCCGGNQSLKSAVEAAGLPPAPILDALATLAARQAEAGVPDWNEASPTDLIEHILARYHAVHREQLPELIRLAHRVEQVHGDREECPLGLADLLTGMHQALESHMHKEESILFPMIARGHGAMADGPIAVMRMEHDDHGEALHQLEALTGGVTTPRGACTTWRALYTGLRTFREDLMTHIHLENNILFERFCPQARH